MENGKSVTKNSFLKRVPLLSIVGLFIGAIGGYIYYSKIGCISGTCAITSNPWMSTLWGAAFGYLVFDMFAKRKKGEIENHNTQESK
ncbi:MAG: DUF6132 family protein [Bacteroidales bacterium]